MRMISHVILLVYGLHCSIPSFAASASGGGAEGDGSAQDSQKKLVTYLLNLGLYLGYNLKKNPNEETKQEANQKLLSMTESVLRQKDQLLIVLFNSFLGSIPVNTAGTKNFVPDNNAYNIINSLANGTFKTPPYSAEAPNNLSVTRLIDQPKYQEDPISQAILNILGTPSYTYCLDNDETTWKECLYLKTSPQIVDKQRVTNNVIGNKIPDKDLYFTYGYNQTVLSQLNSESLIAPLLYNNAAEEGASNSSSSGGYGNDNPGLTAKSPLQQAGNFIRYATNSVIPLPLAGRKEYAAVYDAIFDSKRSDLERFKAQSTLSQYLAGIRVYAAQASVPISNLYWILSKRMPQKVNPEGNAAPTSEALSEFTMATWRLFKPENQQASASSKPWMEQLNTASAATVQKEIAVLLAEINYQLYLSRQQQERILLTNSLLVIQNLKNFPPNLNATAQAEGFRELE